MRDKDKGIGDTSVNMKFKAIEKVVELNLDVDISEDIHENQDLSFINEDKDK